MSPHARIGTVNGQHRHGHRGLKRSPTYLVWMGMRARTGNPNHRSWHLYGGVGVTCCDRWSSFECFLADMGERPEPLDGMTYELDRIDPEGPYAPHNCRWLSKFENQSRRHRPWPPRIEPTPHEPPF